MDDAAVREFQNYSNFADLGVLNLEFLQLGVHQSTAQVETVQFRNPIDDLNNILL